MSGGQSDSQLETAAEAKERHARMNDPGSYHNQKRDTDHNPDDKKVEPMTLEEFWGTWIKAIHPGARDRFFDDLQRLEAGIESERIKELNLTIETMEENLQVLEAGMRLPLKWYYDDDSEWGYIIGPDGIGTTLGYEGPLIEAHEYFKELASILGMTAEFLEGDDAP